jgi:hypothetical protein
MVEETLSNDTLEENREAIADETWADFRRALQDDVSEEYDNLMSSWRTEIPKSQSRREEKYLDWIMSKVHRKKDLEC